MTKRIVITTGDPAGCGPTITLRAIEKIKKRGVQFCVVGDKKILEKEPHYRRVKKRIELIDAHTPGISAVKKGVASTVAGRASLGYLMRALALIKKDKISCLVTAPVCKEAIQRIMPGFQGHTELLARFFKVKKFCMMMSSKKLNVILLTRHLPLRDVSKRLSQRLVLDTIELTYSFLKRRLKISHPKIAITSFNPHAGVNTFLEREEKKLIAAIRSSKRKIWGPYPSDTLFVSKNLNRFDCIIACYHDQGMIPFKLLSFGDGVNVTLGLPIIRTSPAHGTAFDAITKKQRLSASSMQAAIECALRLAYETD
jgi:4-hydroxythreonine-4-phosphate dehydrogenase